MSTSPSTGSTTPTGVSTDTPASSVPDISNPLSAFSGRTSLNALLDDRAQHDPDLPWLFVTKSVQPAFEWLSLTYGQVDQCVRAATRHYSRFINVRQKGEPFKQIAIYAGSGLDLWITELAILRLGHGVVLLSPNNSVAAVVHLLTATNSQMLIFGPDKASPAEQAVQTIKSEVAILQQLSAIQIFAVGTDLQSYQPPSKSSHPDPFQTTVPYADQANEPAITLHSSGSTGFPKPLSYSHSKYLTMVGDPVLFDAFCTAPLFHGFGSANAWRTYLLRKRFYLYSETIRADLLKQAISTSQAQIFYAVPFVFKVLSEASGGIELLKRFGLCCFSGAPCPQEVGDRLVQAGVRFIGFVGSTEAGQTMDSLRDFETDKGWNIYRPTERFSPFVSFENVGIDEQTGPFEMVIHHDWKALIKHNREDGSYATGDLFDTIRNTDGTVKGYTYLGRNDDTLVHYSGEKTNPVPMEQTFRSSPLLRDCLVFGAGQPHTGALIVPYESTWAKYSHLEELQRQAALKADIKSLIEDVNKQAPSHSRLMIEMIQFLPPETTFPQADKGTIKRSPANAMFADQIVKLYSDFDLGISTSEANKVTVESLDQVAVVIQKILEEYLEIDLTGKADTDLTKLGADSLMDSQVRSRIHRTFKLRNILPNNALFQNPTLNKLSKVVFRLATGSSGGAETGLDDDKQRQDEQIERTMQTLKSLDSQLTARSTELVRTAAKGGREVVVLTGATGSLGAHILHQLSLKASVARIICFNRSNDDQGAEKRTEESLKARGLPSIDQLERAHGDLKIESVAVELNQDRCGLSQSKYDDIRSNLTCVIHNAWPVNFNMELDSFIDSLEGTVELMNLAGQSTGCAKPRFLFSSSISVALRSSEPLIHEQVFEDLNNTLFMGYAQSKWIVEQLCLASQKRIGNGFQAVVMRIGQMVGDRSNGIWNESEAPPLMIRSAQVIDCLPDLQEELYWLPVDSAGYIAAQLTSLPIPAINETAGTDDGTRFALVHVTNESSIPWSSILASLAEAHNLGDKSFQIVPPAEWVSRLAKSDPNPAHNPTIKLLQHYEAQILNGQDGKVKGKFDTRRLRDLFELQGLKSQIDEHLQAYKEEFLAKTIASWKKSGFLRSTA